MIKDIIDKLKEFAPQSFPVPEVTSYILGLNLNENELKFYSFHKENFYTRNLIHKDSDFELMVICWPPNTTAPIHGHEGEKCWARVQEGQLEICNYEEISSKPLELKMTQKLSCSPGFLDGPADIHAINNCYKEPVKTLHVYAKPYDSCDIYDLKTNQIHRLKMNYYSIDGKIC